MRRLLLMLALLVPAARAAEPEPQSEFTVVKRLPVDVFSRSDDSSDLLISPDGTHAAQSVIVDGAGAIAVYTLEPFQQVNLLGADDDLRIIDLRWATPTRLAYGKGDRSDGTVRSIGGIFAIDVDGKRPKVLREAYSYSAFTGLLGDHADGEGDILVIEYPRTVRAKTRLINTTGGFDPTATTPVPSDRREQRARDAYRQPTLQRLDVYTGVVAQVDELAGMPSGGVGVLLDEDERARFAAAYHRFEYAVMWRPGDEWTPFEPAGFERRNLLPLHYSAAEHSLYFAGSQNSAPLALFAIDGGTGVLRQLYAHATADIDGVVASLDGKTVVGARVYADKPEYHWLKPDDIAAATFRALDQAFSGQEFSITSIARDQTRAIAHVWSDINPGEDYLLDIPSGKVNLLLARRPWIDRARMRPKEVIEVKARDGLPLHGYLTRPRDGAAAASLVLIVHPAPARERVVWGFESLTQMLANHGYAVLQLNYRGSAGYGDAFRRAGFGQWGGTMQDDLADAVHWAIDRGIARKGDVCVYGAGYGGYAALMASVRDPGLYACAISYDGFIDLERLRDYTTSRWGSAPYTREEVLGDDMKSLRERSPVRNAQRIEVPVLLIAGTSDMGEEIEEMKRMRGALNKADRTVESQTIRRDGDVSDEAITRSLFVAMLDFLARHLDDGRAPTPH